MDKQGANVKLEGCITTIILLGGAVMVTYSVVWLIEVIVK